MLYFAYGANTNRCEMARRCPGAAYLGNGMLAGHELVFRGVADVRSGPSIVTGALWDIGRLDLDALDHYEGYPSHYGRHSVPVRIHEPQDGAERVFAIVYAMTGSRNLAPPPKRYLDALTEGYAACSLPKEQLERAVTMAYEEWDGIDYRSRLWG